MPPPRATAPTTTTFTTTTTTTTTTTSAFALPLAARLALALARPSPSWPTTCVRRAPSCMPYANALTSAAPPSLPPTSLPPAPLLPSVSPPPPPPSRRFRARARSFPSDTAYTDYARELANHPPLPHAAERALLRQASFLRVREQLGGTDAEAAKRLGLTLVQLQSRRRRALRARDRLVTANLRLVVKVAAIMHGATAAGSAATRANDLVGVSRTDLIQEGSLALIRAAELFDTAKGERFSSYAFRAIWSRCQRAATPASCIVSIPIRLKIAAKKLRQFNDQFEREHGIEPSDEIQAGVSPSEKLGRVRECQRHLQGGVYLDRRLRGRQGDGTVTVLDTLASCGLVPEDVVHRDLIRRRVREACDKQLSRRDAEILGLRFGLDNGRPVLAKDIAVAFGISAPRVTQIVLQSLEKLRVNEPELGELIHDL